MAEAAFDRKLVDEFLESRVFAVVGVSTNRNKFGYKVYEDLKRAGYTVYPVNPLYPDIFGDRCYPDLASLPERPDVVEFVCPPEVTERLVRELPSLGITRAWMQPGAETENAIAFCREHGILVLYGICVMVEIRKRGKALRPGGEPKLPGLPGD